MPAAADRVPRPAVILGAEPQLFTQDLTRSRAFYSGQLGFSEAFAYGEPPFYLQVTRDEARLNIRQVHGPVLALGFRDHEPDALAATLVLDDAGALYREFQARGVQFHKTLRTEPWGAHTFVVRDPDGNLLCFAGRSR